MVDCDRSPTTAPCSRNLHFSRSCPAETFYSALALAPRRTCGWMLFGYVPSSAVSPTQVIANRLTNAFDTRHEETREAVHGKLAPRNCSDHGRIPEFFIGVTNTDILCR